MHLVNLEIELDSALSCSFSDVQALSAQWTSMAKEERAEVLQITLKDHLLRRMKRDVIKDLPKKTEIIVPLSLTPLQK